MNPLFEARQILPALFEGPSIVATSVERLFEGHECPATARKTSAGRDSLSAVADEVAIRGVRNASCGQVQGHDGV
jgi:hypothetical protein